MKEMHFAPPVARSGGLGEATKLGFFESIRRQTIEKLASLSMG
jgi:hypothetical protein